MATNWSTGDPQPATYLLDLPDCKWVKNAYTSYDVFDVEMPLNDYL